MQKKEGKSANKVSLLLLIFYRVIDVYTSFDNLTTAVVFNKENKHFFVHYVAELKWSQVTQKI